MVSKETAMGSGSSKDVAYDPKKDQCFALLNSYVECVEGKRRGLREGDECLEEGAAYKVCRKKEKQTIIERARRESASSLEADIKQKVQATEEAAIALEAHLERKAKALKKDLLSRKN